MHRATKKIRVLHVLTQSNELVGGGGDTFVSTLQGNRRLVQVDSLEPKLHPELTSPNQLNCTRSLTVGLCEQEHNRESA